MPAMNRTILTSLWTHLYFRLLSSVEKFVYLFLLCGPCTSELSVYSFPITFMAPYLSMITDQLTDVIKSLENKGLIIYDWKYEEIFVVHFL